MFALLVFLLASLTSPWLIAASAETASSSTKPPDWALIEKIAREKNLSSSLIWRRLGHYRCGWFGCESEQDGAEFFLSPKGASDPDAELLATIEAFRSNTLRNFQQSKAGQGLAPQTSRCQFPARLTWLARETGGWLADPLLVGCEKYQSFAKSVQAPRVSLIFSSFYLNNPSSSFGHTLFKFHSTQKNNENSSDKEDGSVRSDLLSRGISYAANPTTHNPVLYAVMGIVGGFSGSYASLPYYYKVREYNDYESRDIWEYELNVSPSEIDMMIKHLWELGYSDFDYFYLSENCAYHLMQLLDVASERLDLSEPLPYWVLPLDTVKAVVNTPGLIRQVHHRLSLARTLEQRFNGLNEREKKLYFATIKNYEISPEQRAVYTAHTLDAVIDQFDMQNGEKLMNKNIAVAQQKHKLLTLRSQMPDLPVTLTKGNVAPPHESHDSLRFELGVGTRTKMSTRVNDDDSQVTKDSATVGRTHFGVRFSLHDLTDPTWGLPDYARLEMFAWNGYLDNEDDRLHTGRWRFVGIEALNSWNTLWARPAWRFDMGGDRILDERCIDCLATGVGGAIGLAKDFWGVTPFIYLNARARFGEFVNEDFSPESGGSAGLRVIGPHDFNFLGEFERRVVWNDFQQTYSVITTQLQKTFRRKYAVRLQYEHSTGLRTQSNGVNEDLDQYRFSFLLFE